MSPLTRRAYVLEGNMVQVLWKLSLPIMAGNFIQTLYNLVDTFWLGRLGASEFAATAFSWPVIFFTLSIGMGLGVAGTALISREVGAGRPRAAGETAGRLLGLMLITGVLLAGVGRLASPWVLKAMGAEGRLLEAASAYLSVMFFDLPLLFASLAVRSIRQGQGDTLSPMLLNGFCVLLNMVLDPLFIFTLGWGIRGAAWATVVSKIPVVLVGAKLVFRDDKAVPCRPGQMLPEKAATKEILKLGIPASLGQAGASLGFIVMNAFVVSYGAFTLAAFGIGNRINSLVMMPALGIGMALAAVIGQNLGAGRHERARLAFRKAMVLSLGVMAGGSVLVVAFALPVLGVFTSEPEVLAQGVYYTRLIGLSLPLMAVLHVLIGTFQGAGRTGLAMLLQIGRLWLFRIPLIMLLKPLTFLGPKAVWYAMVASNLLICLAGTGLYLFSGWDRSLSSEPAQSA